MRRRLRVRGKFKFLRQFKLICPVQSGLKKCFAYRFTRNTIISTAVPPLWRGVSRSSRTLVRDAVDAAARLTNALKRTAKLCGPDAPTLASSLRRQTAGDGGKKARS